MKWIHINKYGVNVLFDAEQIRLITFAKQSDTGACVLVTHKDGHELLIESDILKKSNDKCHEIVREISTILAADVVKA